MNKRILALAGILLLGVAIGFAVAHLGGKDDVGATAPEERKILYWQAPMNPDFRSDKPGKSPMGMDLVPVYEGEETGAGAQEPALRINPAVINNLGVRTAPVERGTLHRPIDTIGFIVPNDNLLRHVNVRSEGWIEELFFKTVGEDVTADEILFRIYSPAVVNAQEEYLQALRLGNTSLADAARERLLALGMARQQIAALGARRKVTLLTDVRAPQAGTILELGAAEGMFVKPGDRIMSLADLSSLWVMVEVFEDQVPWVAAGQKATMRLAFAPGRAWEGTVDYVYPTVNPKSRTVRVRLVFANPDGVLKPDMYAQIVIHAAAKPDTLFIPREALIRAGGGERVILALGEGRFRPAKVVAGVEAGDRMEIVSGLKAGETVVTSGQFLIDSEASLDASLMRLSADESEAMSSHEGMGDMK